MPLRHRNNDRLTGSFGLEVILETLPDCSGPHTDDILLSRVVVGRATEYVNSDLLFPDIFSLATESLFAQVQKELAEDGSIDESSAGCHALYEIPAGVSRRAAIIDGWVLRWRYALVSHCG